MSFQRIPNSVRVISFDLDDTLWNSDQVILHAEGVMQEWMATHTPLVNTQLSPDELRTKKFQFIKDHPHLYNRISLARQLFLQSLFADLGYQQANKLAQDCFQAFYHARQQVSLFDDVLETLRELKKQYQIIAMTNGNADVNLTPLKGMFELALVAETFERPKPHDDMFKHVLEVFDVQAEQVLHVGDHPEHDMLGAFEMGMHTCWLKDGSRDWDQPFQAHMTISHIRELLD